MWYNKYVGIPYQDKGRDYSGVDCWGLVRLVYSEQFNTELPSFDTTYIPSDIGRIEQLFTNYKDSWEEVTQPREGDVVLFKVLGCVSHIGVMLDSDNFLHSIQGRDSCIERISNHRWSTRVKGVFRYTENTDTGLCALPPELVTHKLVLPIESGKLSLKDAKQYAANINSSNIPGAEVGPVNIVLFLNGKIILDNELDYVLQDQDVLEYRLVPSGGDVERAIAVVAVVALAVYTGGAAAAFVANSSFAATMSVAGANALGYVAGMVAQTLVMGVGMALVNQIFPPKQPDPGQQPGDPGIAKNQLQLTGSSNQINRYGAVPAVLGTFRINAPLAAQNLVSTDIDITYLRMLLCWGYGPLEVSDLRIGATPLSDYSDVQVRTTIGANNTEINSVLELYGSDTQQIGVNKDLPFTEPSGIPGDSQEVAFTQVGNSVSFDISFPQGLRGSYREGNSAGSTFGTPFHADYTLLELDSNGNAVGSPFSPGQFRSGQTISVATGPGSFGTGLSCRYKLVTVYMAKNCSFIDVSTGYAFDSLSDSYTYTEDSMPTVWGIFSRTGVWPLKNVSIQPSIQIGNTQYYTLYSLRIDNLTNTITTLVDNRSTYGISGGALSYTFTSGSNIATLTIADITAITVNAGVDNTLGYGNGNIRIGQSGQAFYNRKDAFTLTVNIYGLKPARYKLSIKRLTSDEQDLETQSGKPYLYNKATLMFASITNTLVKPVTQPVGTNLALTSVYIKATDQLNGSVEGINALVSSICLDYDSISDTWIARKTNNPASLYRYVLQHPGNSVRKEDSEIDLVRLKDWHTYCKTNGFTYNNVMTEQRSLLEVLKDIAAAGRASPLMNGDKWSVVIDRERTVVSQAFTTKNSWEFGGSKRLFKEPHGIRVSFINAEKEYQSEDLIVYNDGYSENNASVFESISLPGITSASLVHKHARFHLAQAKLRPETYTLSTDAEYIVCERGDLVVITHDVPMWGIGSARIKSSAGNVLELDDQVQLEVGKQYSVLIRTQSGLTLERGINNVVSTDYYKSITVQGSALTADQNAIGNLCLLGETNKVAQKLIVLSIEPRENLTAQLTLTDYSPEIYNIDNQPIPSFNSNITTQDSFSKWNILTLPTILSITSDESAMELSGSTYIYRMAINITVPPVIEEYITNIEVRACLKNDTSKSWRHTKVVNITEPRAFITDLIEQEIYVVQARFTSAYGTTGPWTAEVEHTIVGRTTVPPDVSNFSITGTQLFWDDVLAVDLAGYKVRYHRGTNLDWGTANPMHSGLLQQSPFDVSNSLPSGTTTIMIKAVDSIGLESNNIAYIISKANDVIMDNLVITYDYTGQGYPGTLEYCTYSPGTSSLVAVSNNTFYGTDSASFYGHDSDPFYEQEGYYTMTYTTPELYVDMDIPGIDIVLETDYLGDSITIEYRKVAPSPFYTPGPFYGSSGTDSFYGPPGAWLPMPARLPVHREVYQFRITINSSSPQGELKVFRLHVDAPDILEKVDNLEITSSPTVIPITKPFTAIRNVQVTIQAGTSGAVYAIVDKTNPSAPTVTTYNSSNTPVTGAIVDIIIQGY